jgi:hypothetical protein
VVAERQAKIEAEAREVARVEAEAEAARVAVVLVCARCAHEK